MACFEKYRKYETEPRRVTVMRDTLGTTDIASGSDDGEDHDIIISSSGGGG